MSSNEIAERERFFRGDVSMTSTSNGTTNKCKACFAHTYCIITETLVSYCDGPFEDEAQLNSAAERIVSLYA